MGRLRQAASEGLRTVSSAQVGTLRLFSSLAGNLLPFGVRQYRDRAHVYGSFWVANFVCPLKRLKFAGAERSVLFVSVCVFSLKKVSDASSWKSPAAHGWHVAITSHLLTRFVTCCSVFMEALQLRQVTEIQTGRALMLSAHRGSVLCDLQPGT